MQGLFVADVPCFRISGLGNHENGEIKLYCTWVSVTRVKGGGGQQ